MTDRFRKQVEKAAALLKNAGCKEIYLFGSLAEEREHENSDIDLAIRGCPPGRFFELLGKLMLELDCRVDLVDLDRNEPFTKHLLAEGTMIDVS